MALPYLVLPQRTPPAEEARGTLSWAKAQDAHAGISPGTQMPPPSAVNTRGRTLDRQK